MAKVNVKCPYCNEFFDRNNEKYVKPNSRRYAHLKCYLEEREKDKSLLGLEIVDPKGNIVCQYCGETIEKIDENIQKIEDGKYIHAKCAEVLAGIHTKLLTEREEEKKAREEDAVRARVERKKRLAKPQDQIDLENYIMKMFKWDYVHARVQRQIKHYVDDLNFSYSGIRKALIYFYEVKQNSLEKANSGIGIVEYVYEEAFEYFYALWEAQQQNINIKVEEYVPQVKEVVIPVPQIQTRSRNQFSFLDEEEVSGK